ncbi:hypothetical protein [Bartonella sp. HY761]|uniref:hypothetical protein n=1 Tax=Bartonella sp. HY761 TaxID=2979330 RepID=UPI00220C5240|nr:hypothetical protein [Bartonella sp. HY761]UXN05410.1 hypothetical protein N6A79_08815 [Bartonella sp. HY761]
MTAYDLNSVANDYIKIWNYSEKYKTYREQTGVLTKLFQNKSNDELNLLEKIDKLNQFFSTRLNSIFDTMHVIQSIENIDDRIEKNDITVVNELADGIKAVSGKRCYSFATKWCFHNNRDYYPIYDSYVAQQLILYNERSRYANFIKDDLKDYNQFILIIEAFKSHYNINRLSVRDLDLFLWVKGKEENNKQKAFKINDEGKKLNLSAEQRFNTIQASKLYVKDLLQDGFHEVGSWKLDDSERLQNKKLKFSNYDNLERGLFALAVDDQVYYIGHTIGNIKASLKFIQYGNPKQKTYHRLHNLIIDKLKNNESISSYIFPLEQDSQERLKYYVCNHDLPENKHYR